MFEHVSDLLTYGGLFVIVFGMAWTDGVDRATNYIVTATNWNDLIGAAGSLMQLKSHAHGGTTGEGSQSIGPLVKETFTDAAAPAAPSAGQTSIYTVSARPRYRANGGADRAIVTDETTAAGDLAGTYPNPTVAKITLGSDADGDIYYRAAGVLARLPKGTALQLVRMNAGATAPEYFTLGSAVTSLDKKITTTTVANTTSETDLYRKAVTGNTIGSGGALRLMIAGDGNALGSGTSTFRLKFGATTLLSLVVQFNTGSAARNPWEIEMTLFNAGATNAQRIEGSFRKSSSTGDAWVNNVGFSDTTMGYATAAEDTTASKDVAVTVQHSVASASTDAAARIALLELLV